MVNKWRIFLLLFSALVLSGCIITGKVTDENGDGIEGVTVNLTGDANLTTTTNNRGVYIFGNFLERILGFTSDDLILIMPGSYTVVPSKRGYRFTPTGTDVSVTSEYCAPLAADLTQPVGGVNFEAEFTGATPGIEGDVAQINCDFIDSDRTHFKFSVIPIPFSSYHNLFFITIIYFISH